MPYPRVLTEPQMDRIIGMILRGGVIISALIVLVGAVFYLYGYGFMLPEYRIFRGEPSDLRHVSGIIKDVLDFKSPGIIQFGLLVLIATPIARVAFSVIAFSLQRDRVYVMVTLIVLALLLYSLVGGGR
jgi:uncharacterized membrane protein